MRRLSAVPPCPRCTGAISAGEMGSRALADAGCPSCRSLCEIRDTRLSLGPGTFARMCEVRAAVPSP